MTEEAVPDVRHIFFDDDNGNPAGGISEGKGFLIAWQQGPLTLLNPENGEVTRLPQTGAFVEHVLTACLGRLEYYQDSKFNHELNAHAITHIREALFDLNERTREREERGVEGTHQV